MAKELKSKICIVIGVLSIIFSIVCFGMKTGGIESNKSYGGDAYTGMQQASAQTANNVVVLASIAKTGFGFVLFIGGATLILYGIPTNNPMLVSDTNNNSVGYTDLPEL